MHNIIGNQPPKCTLPPPPRPSWYAFLAFKFFLCPMYVNLNHSCDIVVLSDFLPPSCVLIKHPKSTEKNRSPIPFARRSIPRMSPMRVYPLHPYPAAKGDGTSFYLFSWHHMQGTVISCATKIYHCHGCWCSGYPPKFISGLGLGLRPANERRRYKVTPSLIRWAQT